MTRGILALLGVLLWAQSAAAQFPLEKRIAIIAINFTNDQTVVYPPALLRAYYFTNANSVANFYGMASYGRWHLSGQVFGTYTVPYPNTDCGAMFSGWMQAAKQAATRDGYQDANFDAVQVIFLAACPWGGAYMGGHESFVTGPQYAIHELGHDFGLGHGSALYCVVNGLYVTYAPTSLLPPAAPCISIEYGDPLNPMAFGSADLPMTMKMQLGMVTQAEMVTASVSGRYHIRPANEVPSALVIADHQESVVPFSFWLEYRTPTQNNANVPAADLAGLFVRVAAPPPYGVGWLLDLVPDGNFLDALLEVGHPWTHNGMTVSLVSFDSAGATVDVALGSIVVTVAPAPAGKPSFQ